MSPYSTMLSDKKSTDFVDTLWIPLISLTHCNNVHKFRGQALNSTYYVDRWSALLQEIYLFCGIQKRTIRTKTTTTHSATEKPNNFLSLQSGFDHISWYPRGIWDRQNENTDRMDPGRNRVQSFWLLSKKAWNKPTSNFHGVVKTWPIELKFDM